MLLKLRVGHTYHFGIRAGDSQKTTEASIHYRGLILSGYLGTEICTDENCMVSSVQNRKNDIFRPDLCLCISCLPHTII